MMAHMVRVLVYEGSQEAIDEARARSLPVGRKSFNHREHGPGSITVIELSDLAVRTMKQAFAVLLEEESQVDGGQ